MREEWKGIQMSIYEGELDIDNKLNNILKIAGILNNVFRPQKNP